MIDLSTTQGQSPWLDNLQRDWIQDGELQRWVERGVRGITSNPTIFQKAIVGRRRLRRAVPPLARGRHVGRSTSYWELVVDDIRDALAILRPVHDASDGVDGYVSVEVVAAAGPRHRRHRRRRPATSTT